jgi:hypothetical protein
VSRYWILFFLLVVALPGLSQKRKNKKAADTPVEAFFPQKEYGPKVSNKGFLGPGKKKKVIIRRAKDDYEAREAALARRARKNEWQAGAFRSADARYFGHKKIPRKRPPDKMKYCRVCGIRH